MNHDYNFDLRNMHDKCREYKLYHVHLTMTDGRAVDGIIEDVDRDGVTVLVGEDVAEEEMGRKVDDRQFYGGYRPRRRFRRFRRRRFPLATLTALALLPYIAPYPYPYAYPYAYPYSSPFLYY